MDLKNILALNISTASGNFSLAPAVSFMECIRHQSTFKDCNCCP